MKKKSLLFSLLGLLMSIFNTGIQAQVTIGFIQPPSNEWSMQYMWNLTITNNSGKDQVVKLKGTLEEKRKGLIADASSSFFTAKPGTYPVHVSDLNPVSTNYVDKKYEDIMLSTGTMPDGDYIICVIVYSAANIELSKDCIEQPIHNLTPPELTYPSDGETLKDSIPVFQWMPPMPTPAEEIITYTLKIVELLDGQVPIEAMESNPAFFTKESIHSPYFQFQLSSRNFVGKTNFAWQVTANGKNYEIGKSQVWSFNTLPEIMNPMAMVSPVQTKIDSIKVECDGKDSKGNQKYKVTVRFFNLNNNSNCTTYLCYPATGQGSSPPLACSNYLNIILGSSNITNVSPLGGPTPIPYSSTVPTIITFNMTNPSLPIKIEIESGIICGTTHNGTQCTTPFAIEKLPVCPCTDCDTIALTFDNFNTSAFGTSGYRYNIAGNININVPIYQLECQVQSYKYTATPSGCSMGVNYLEQSGMFLRPDTKLNNSTSIIMFNETISGLSTSNNNAAKAVKIISTTPITGPIPVKLTIGIPGPIAGISQGCCKMDYTVCVKVIVFYDANLCKSCTFTHCFDFTNQ